MSRNDKDRTGITLEAFAPPLQSSHMLQHMLQALNLSRLVAQEQDWLREARPDVLKSYYYPTTHGKKNIARLAASTEAKAYIVRKSIVAIGLATITFNTTVVHPDEGEIEGDHLDYWLQQGLDETTHSVVAGKLIKMSQREDMFATIAQDTPNPSTGFAYHMDQVGDPAILEVEPLSDEFDIAKNGIAAQLYELGDQRRSLQYSGVAVERD